MGVKKVGVIKQTKNKPFRRALSLALTLCMALAIGSTANNASATSLKPGEVAVGKTAQPVDGQKDVFKVDMKIDSKDVLTTGGNADVVLVIDNSGSMSGTRIIKAKESAKKFVDELIVAGANNRIGIATYESEAKTRIDFSSDKAELYKAIDGIKSEGLTYTQGGLYEARKMIETKSRDNAKKSVVLLCDGDANERAKYIGITDDRVAIDHADHKVTLTGRPNKFDYTSTNTAYNFDVTKKCPTCGQEVTQNFQGYEDSSDACAEAAILEGKLTGKAGGGTSIYSVGLELNTGGQAETTLRAIQNSGFYNINDVNELQPLLEEIAKQIKKAAGTNAVVTEKISDNFTLVDASITAAPGTATYDKNTNTITWTIGSILESDEISLSYKVLAKPELVRPGQYLISDESKLTYKDSAGQDVTKDFKAVEVSVGLYKDVKVKYLEEGTKKELLTEQILKDKAVGASVDGKALKQTIEGYEVVSITPETLVVTEKDEDNIIVISYKKISEKPVQPETPKEPEDKNPKTGESNAASGIALLSIIALSGLVLARKLR